MKPEKCTRRTDHLPKACTAVPGMHRAVSNFSRSRTVIFSTYRGVKLEKAALDMGAVDPDTHRISLGLVYSIPVF